MKSRAYSASLHPAQMVLLAILLLLQGSLAAEDKTPTEGAALLARAAEILNIQSGSQPFRMKARIQLVMSNGSVEADYLLVWVSKEQWREEMRLPGYSEVRGAGGGKQWQTRNLAFVPLRVMQAYDTLRFSRRVGLGGGEDVTEVRRRKIDGAEVTCIEVKGPQALRRSLCLDPKTAAVVEMQESYPSLICQFRDYAPFGQKLYPRTLQAFEVGKLVLEARVQELVAESAPSAALFVAPEGAWERPSCDTGNVKVGKLLNRVTPPYPELAKRNREAGRVTMYALIRADGTIGDLTVVRSAGQKLDQAALDAVRKWRYEPYLCNGTPMPVETLIDVNFSLSSY